MAGGASGRLRGKSAIVTGARRSIGRAIAAALAGEGAGIVVHYRTGRDEAEVTLAALRAGGADAIGFGGDLSDSAVVTALFEQAREHFGGWTSWWRTPARRRRRRRWLRCLMRCSSRS
jgi:3-oxoacyl-[acyl-carrier protein] reductase